MITIHSVQNRQGRVKPVDYMWSGAMWLPLFCNTCKHCSRVEQDRTVQTMSLTSACWVHSNVYVLVNTPWIRYLTAVDPILSTSSAFQKYHHLISGSVEIWWLTIAGNSSSIGKEPVSFGRPVFTSIRLSATSSLVCYTEKRVISFTNVLQGHTTVVLVCSTIEWDSNITCTCEVWIFNRMYKFYIYSPIPQFYLLSMLRSNPLRYLNLRQLFTVCETSCSTREAYSLIQCLSKDNLSTLDLKWCRRREV